MNRLIASALAAFALAAIAAPSALAEGRTVSVKVSYADLDLASPADAHTMLARLEKASRKACGERTRNLHEMRSARSCATKAMTSAVTRLKAPIVTAMFVDADRYSVASR